jgi:hypothetical protein
MADIYRSSAGDVHTAGSIVYNNTFGQETMSMTSSHGNDITFSGQTASWFNPNNMQIKTNGNHFSDTQGHRTTYTKRDHYLVTGGTLTITSGHPRLFDKDDKTLTEYVKERSELAAARCSPGTFQGGRTNNSKTEFEMRGSVDPESGSTEGKSFPPNPGRQNYKELMSSKASKLASLERKMGEGGDIVFTAGKDLCLSAGTKAVSIDSGYINPVGAKIVKGYKIDGGKDKGQRAVPQYTSAPSYQEKDTTSTIPFGSLILGGSNRVMIKTGAGGFNVEGAGSVKLVGTGLSWLGGAQVNLVSSGTTFMNSAALMVTTTTFSVNSPESVLSGNLNVNQNTIIGGNLEVGGDLTVYGDIYCKGTITADVDVLADGISLKNHVHPHGEPETGPPKK